MLTHPSDHYLTETKISGREWINEWMSFDYNVWSILENMLKRRPELARIKWSSFGVDFGSEIRQPSLRGADCINWRSLVSTWWSIFKFIQLHSGSGQQAGLQSQHRHCWLCSGLEQTEQCRKTSLVSLRQAEALMELLIKIYWRLYFYGAKTSLAFVRLLSVHHCQDQFICWGHWGDFRLILSVYQDYT